MYETRSCSTETVRTLSDFVEGEEGREWLCDHPMSSIEQGEAIYAGMEPQQFTRLVLMESGRQCTFTIWYLTQGRSELEISGSGYLVEWVISPLLERCGVIWPTLGKYEKKPELHLLGRTE